MPTRTWLPVQACIDRLTLAAGLYKGDLLKNLTIPDSLAFEEWLLLARERMRLQMIDGIGPLGRGQRTKCG